MAFSHAEAKEAYRMGRALGESMTAEQAFGGMVNAVVGGIFAVALGVVMLNQLFSLSIINTTTGPFATLFDTVENIGGAAITFIVLGFLAAAGGLAVRMFRG
jgi:hypothetical protein